MFWYQKYRYRVDIGKGDIDYRPTSTVDEIDRTCHQLATVAVG